MINTIVLIAYLVSLAVFILLSIFALRHTVKFGYISRKFKTLAWVFGIVALTIVIFSIYLIVALYKPGSGTVAPKASVKNINY
jgi:hypothetical protein